MKRDKEATKQRIVEAVGKVLAEQGYAGIGVNSIAKEAGVDKVLIYRYYSDLDGLLEAFALRKDFVSNLESFLGREEHAPVTKQDALALGKRILIGQFRQILKDRGLQEVLLWELHEQNRVTEAVAEAREKQGQAFLTQMAGLIDDSSIDIPAVASLLVGGIYYLALRSRTVEVYSGINLRTEKGWKRIESAVSLLLDMVAARE